MQNFQAKTIKIGKEGKLYMYHKRNKIIVQQL